MTSAAFAKTPACWSIYQSCCVMVYVLYLLKSWLKRLIQEVPGKCREVKPQSTPTLSLYLEEGWSILYCFRSTLGTAYCNAYLDISNWWCVNVLQEGHITYGMRTNMMACRGCRHKRGVRFTEWNFFVLGCSKLYDLTWLRINTSVMLSFVSLWPKINEIL